MPVLEAVVADAVVAIGLAETTGLVPERTSFELKLSTGTEDDPEIPPASVLDGWCSVWLDVPSGVGIEGGLVAIP